MRRPAPRQVVPARDKPRAENALNVVPVPGTVATVQNKTTKIIRRVGMSVFFPYHACFPVLAGRLRRLVNGV